MIRCVLSSQTYGPVDPEPTKALRIATMHSANNSIQWVSDVSASRMSYGCARNNAVLTTLNAVDAGEEIDYLVWIDSDIICEPNSITALVKTASENGYDFVTGIYHTKNDKECLPVIYDFDKRWWPRSGIFNKCIFYPLNVIIPMGGCGFGMCVTSIKMLQGMRASRHWHERGKWFPDTRDVRGGFGEDLMFCKIAIQAGYKLYCNTGIQVGHQGAGRVFTIEDFNEHRKLKVLEAREEV